ncbi:IclR family transcriptional regulator [Dactylosporangium sp. CA-233914]|uniref:IclR family transcriptional regulator n=1 Tax=Dactylosporangium sp. CA-233914 TaxID=3239934 RepID=UPI003D8BC981
MSSRLLELLFAFRPERSLLSLADLVRETGLPHATARRLVLELEEAGAIDRCADGRFAIGVRLWQLGTLAPRTESLRILAKPFMDDLYTALRQHVQLAVLDDDHAVIIERMSAPHAVNLVSEVGGRLPLHCSGVGKVLLSHTDHAFIDRILAGPLPTFTAQTNVNPPSLRREIAACRRTGTAMVRGELTVGADSVATRIVDRDGRVVAALSVVVRTGSVRPQATVPSVVASGLGISRALGWRPGIAVSAS